MSGPARDPIAITALSSFSGFGAGASVFAEALMSGRSSIAPVASFDTSAAQAHLASEIKDFDAAQYIAPAKLRRIDRIGRLAVAACGVALKDAGLVSATGHDDVGIAIGSNTSGVHSLVDYLDRLRTLGPPGASALDFSNTVGNAAASLCGIEFSMRGPNVTLSYKEASSFSAVAYAASLIRAGRARAMVTGGVDDIEPMLFDVHDRFGALATDRGDGEASRPFDRRRNGFVMGTGAFMILIEQAAAAAERGAPIAGQLLGIGATAASAGMNDWPRQPTQIARAMRLGIAEAGLTPGDIGVVFASANSTAQLDRVEADAIADVFGKFAVPVTSIKGAIGECGSTGTASLIAAVLCAKHGIIPPTVGFAEPDPACPVDVSGLPRPWPQGKRAALVNSLAAGGACYSIVVRG